MDRKLRIALLMLIDTLLIAVSIIFAYLLRFDFSLQESVAKYIPYVIGMHIVIAIPTFYFAKLYHRVWQYASINELITLVKSVTIIELIFSSFHLMLQLSFKEIVVPRSIFLLSWVLIIVTIGCSRLVWRIFRDQYLKIKPYHKRVLIVGAGDAGAMVAKEMLHSPFTDLYPVAFADDDPNKLRLEVMGIPVAGGRYDIPNIVEKYHVQEIILAMPSAPQTEISDIINICKETRTKIKIVPRLIDFVNGKISISKIREVNLEDLLGREPVQVDLAGISSYISNKVILVTGAGGSIGSELCRQIVRFAPKELILLGHGENSIYSVQLELRQRFPEVNVKAVIADIQDYKRMNDVFAQFRPEVIFHAAAHKHVPLMEDNPVEAIKNNVFGTRNVAKLASTYHASHFVMISTDKAVNPTSIMGVTKRIAELTVQTMSKGSNTKYVAVRFGNVLGSRGSVVPIFKKQIELGGPVTVTHPEMVRYFMTIPEAVQLVIQAGALANGGEIFILDMGKPVKIDQLARDLIRLSGFVPDEEIKIIYTGIRPGEKLYEEIFSDVERKGATKHERIYVGQPVDLSKDELQFLIKKLEQLIFSNETTYNTSDIMTVLKELVPNYIGKKRADQVSVKEVRTSE